MANTSIDTGDGSRIIFGVLFDSDDTGRGDLGNGSRLPVAMIYDATSGGTPPGPSGEGGLFFAHG